METIGKALVCVLAFIHITFLRLFHPGRLTAGHIQDISASTRIVPKGRISLGKKLHTRRNVVIESMPGAELDIGDDCFFNNNCMIVAKESIRIGSSCSCGPNVMIYDHDHKTDKNTGFIHDKYKSAPVKIGDRVWIGANTVILSGTVIGDGCVVGAGCVLKGRYEAGSRIVQKRMTDIGRIKEE